MPLFGKKKDSKLIVNYMKIIEQSLIPMINEKLDLSINNYPAYEKQYSASYEDTANNILIEFSSGNIHVESEGDLFVSVSYNSRLQPVGLFNVNDASELRSLPDILLESLHELDFETEADKEEKERQAKQAEIDKKAKELAAAEAKKQAELNKKDEEEPEVEEPEEEETVTEEEIIDSHNLIIRALSFIGKMPGDNQTSEINWFVLKDGAEGINIGMNLTKISGNNFYVETYSIRPEIKTIMNAEKVADYADKVSRKVESTPNVEIKNAKGEHLDIPDEEENDYIEI
nr:MAG TPA: hypothetical protein [Caudoviricetes sp.]